MVVVGVVVRGCVPQHVGRSSSTMWVLAASLKGECHYPLSHAQQKILLCNLNHDLLVLASSPLVPCESSPMVEASWLPALAAMFTVPTLGSFWFYVATQVAYHLLLINSHFFAPSTMPGNCPLKEPCLCSLSANRAYLRKRGYEETALGSLFVCLWSFLELF